MRLILLLFLAFLACEETEKIRNPQDENKSESIDPSGSPSPASENPDPSEPKTYDPDNYTSVGLDPYNPCDEGPCEEDIDDVNEPPLEGGATSI